MNLKEYLSITPEISAAIRDGKPVVALESTILSHGMPYPDNLAFAAEVERIVRAEGAVPATMAIIDGVLKVGLTQDELELMCKGEGVAKVSRRDLPIMVAEKRTGATTVASTMILASRWSPACRSICKLRHSVRSRAPTPAGSAACSSVRAREITASLTPSDAASSAGSSLRKPSSSSRSQSSSTACSTSGSSFVPINCESTKRERSFSSLR